MDFSSQSAMTDHKQEIMTQVRQAAAVANAKALIGKINEHCYERCIPKPASSISKGEESCYSACMEKYMAAWNTVSKGYVERMQKDGGIRNIGM